MTISHEFGHWVDLRKNFQPAIKAVREFRVSLQTGSVDLKAQRAILKIENRAWWAAHTILCRIGFTDWETFYRTKASALRSYTDFSWIQKALKKGQLLIK